MVSAGFIPSHSARDSYTRSIVKSLTYRVIGTAITVTMIGLFTGDWELAGGVGVLINFVKIASYFGYERLWEHIPWGRN